MRRIVFSSMGLFLLLFAGWSTAADPQPGTAVSPSAMTLVRQALDADLSGRSAERSSLLRQALDQSPLYAPARWHNGELLLGEQWLPVRQVQQRIAAERALSEYRQLRDQSDGSVAAHSALARFCRKQQWKDREEFHWYNVLRLQPKNREAIAALQLQQYRGQWLTANEIALYKDDVRRAEEALAHWQPILEEAEAAIDAADTPAREKAVAQLRGVRDAAALPALAQSLPNAGEAYSLAVIGALAGIEEQSATEVLTWQALASPYEGVRQAAIDELKTRNWHSFIPLLMSSLSSPLELTYYVNAITPGDIKYGYQVLRDGPTSQTAFSSSTSHTVFRTSTMPVEAHPVYAKARALQVRAAAKSREVVTQQVSAANAVTNWQNERICAVLEQTTGQTHMATSQAWWKWWEEHNELFVEEQKPVRSRRVYRHFSLAIRDALPEPPRSRSPLPPGDPTRKRSCFVPGTLVWTEAGLEPIERIRPGDRVLSQDSDTGELSLRFVQETTVRPASPTRRVRVDQDVILSTLGHPFWAVGKGWRMAKELEADDRLYTLEGSAKIDELQDGPDWEAYNLVVEGFGTYFVGQTGLLVRDNNLGRVPTAPLPGYRLVQAAQR